MTAPLPLDGVRVVDVSEGAQGPVAASLLADLGASVLKVERPEGEMMRHYRLPLKRGVPLSLLNLSRSRAACITLDLKKPDDKERILDLVRNSDIFIENWRPGTADRLGLAYDDLRRVNSEIVYISASGFGAAGPYAAFGSLDWIAAASGGLSSLNGEAGGASEHHRLPLLDHISGMVAAEVALAAIFVQSRCGGSARGETSQLEAAVAAVSPVLALVSVGKDAADGGPLGASDRWVVPSGVFPCRESKFAAIHVDTSARWRALKKILDLESGPEWEEAEARWRARVDVETAIAARTSMLDVDELLSELQQECIPAALVRRSMSDAMGDRKLGDEHVAWRHGGDEVGWVAMPQVPWRFGECDVRVLWPCPQVNAAPVGDWEERWKRGTRSVKQRNDHETASLSSTAPTEVQGS